MSTRFRQIAICVAGCGLSLATAAQQPAAAPSAVTSQVSSLIIGMLLILAVITAVAWLLKRLAPRTYGGSSMLRVVAGVAVGQRERVVIVEVGATWLVVGVAPGSVNTLHQMPRQEDTGRALAAPGAQSPFAHWLQGFIEKRGGNSAEPRK